MPAKQPDMFHSDHVFLRVTSAGLIVLGLSALVITLVARLAGLGQGPLDLLPIFGGYDVFRRDLATINLPLALLILGIGLRLYTPFGWITSTVLLAGMMLGFSLLAWRLGQEVPSYYELAAAHPSQALEHPVLESIAVNIGLTMFCLVFFVYLWLPKVRRLFWATRKRG